MVQVACMTAKNQSQQHINANDFWNHFSGILKDAGWQFNASGNFSFPMNITLMRDSKQLELLIEYNEGVVDKTATGPDGMVSRMLVFDDENPEGFVIHVKGDKNSIPRTWYWANAMGRAQCKAFFQAE